MAAASATTESSLFHPQHSLASYHYSEESTCACAACERIVTGIGYTCEECDFNIHIHEACLTLPGSISFDQHEEHELTLTRLGASRWCNVCKQSSEAGSYMYLCEKCNFDVHPRCTSLLADGTQPRRRGRTRRTVKVGLKIGMFGFKVANVMTGGIFSPVLDVADLVIDNM